jgi:hypothetical protein
MLWRNELAEFYQVLKQIAIDFPIARGVGI